MITLTVRFSLSNISQLFKLTTHLRRRSKFIENMFGHKKKKIKYFRKYIHGTGDYIYPSSFKFRFYSAHNSSDRVLDSSNDFFEFHYQPRQFNAPLLSRNSLYLIHNSMILCVKKYSLYFY